MKRLILLIISITIISCKTFINTETGNNYFNNIIKIRSFILMDLNINKDMAYNTFEDILGDLMIKNSKVNITVSRERNRHYTTVYNYLYEIHLDDEKITVLKSEIQEKYFITDISIELKNKYKEIFPYKTISEYLGDLNFGNIKLENIQKNIITYIYNDYWEYIYLVFDENDVISDIAFRYKID